VGRRLLINILLVIAGILLALALFGAGAVWEGRMKPSRPSVSAPGAVGLKLLDSALTRTRFSLGR
jgi:hypothetical protein